MLYTSSVENLYKCINWGRSSSGKPFSVRSLMVHRAFSLWLRQTRTDWDIKASKHTQPETETTNNTGFHLLITAPVIFTTIWASLLKLRNTALKHSPAPQLHGGRVVFYISPAYYSLMAPKSDPSPSLPNSRQLQGGQAGGRRLHSWRIQVLWSDEEQEMAHTLSPESDLRQGWSMLYFT